MHPGERGRFVGKMQESIPGAGDLTPRPGSEWSYRSSAPAMMRFMISEVPAAMVCMRTSR
jgi:hypothetical protein